MDQSSKDRDRAEGALDDALKRIAGATSENEALNAMGEALKWVHSLEEWYRERLGDRNYFAERAQRHDGQLVGGLVYARMFEHHEIVEVADLDDRWTDIWTDLYGVLVWRQQLPPPKKPGLVKGRDVFYERHAADKLVLETLDVARGFFHHMRTVPALKN